MRKSKTRKHKMSGGIFGLSKKEKEQKTLLNRFKKMYPTKNKLELKNLAKEQWKLDKKTETEWKLKTLKNTTMNTTKKKKIPFIEDDDEDEDESETYLQFSKFLNTLPNTQRMNLYNLKNEKGPQEAFEILYANMPFDGEDESSNIFFTQKWWNTSFQDINEEDSILFNKLITLLFSKPSRHIKFTISD